MQLARDPGVKTFLGKGLGRTLSQVKGPILQGTATCLKTPANASEAKSHERICYEIQLLHGEGLVITSDHLKAFTEQANDWRKAGLWLLSPAAHVSAGVLQ